jgi:hypothetical protein
MNRVVVAIYYLLGLVFFSITIGFAMAEFESLILFYSIMIGFSAAYSVFMIGLVVHTKKHSLLDLKPSDTFTGSILGISVLISANFVFAYLYSLVYASIYGSPQYAIFGLGLLPLQVGSFVIVSHVLIHALIIAPTEEIIFRELMPQGLWLIFRKLLPNNYAVAFAYSIASIVYFAMAHLSSTGFNIVMMGFIVVSSVTLAFIRVKFGLLSCTVAHITNNVVSVFL